jgi:hypothetical protein
MNECMNCDANTQCYECYILSGNEERDIRNAILGSGYARKTDAIREAKVIRKMGYKVEVKKPLGRYYWRIEIV